MTKEEKTKQAFEMIEQGVKDVYSSDNFRKYLSCCSKFHSYSLNNTLLILAQKPDATLVAGYNAWQHNFNRHVDKGERGLIILAPVTSKITQLMDKADEDGNPLLDENGDPIKIRGKKNVVTYFREHPAEWKRLYDMCYDKLKQKEDPFTKSFEEMLGIDLNEKLGVNNFEDLAEM